MNAVEREPVETRVLNPTASEASYKPKKRSYRTTNLKKKVLVPNSPGAELSGAEMSSAESAALNRRRRNVPDPKLRAPFNWVPIGSSTVAKQSSIHPNKIIQL